MGEGRSTLLWNMQAGANTGCLPARGLHPVGQFPVESASHDRGWQVKASKMQTQPSKSYFAISSFWNTVGKLPYMMSLKGPSANPLKNEGPDEEKQEATRPPTVKRRRLGDLPGLRTRLGAHLQTGLPRYSAQARCAPSGSHSPWLQDRVHTSGSPGMTLQVSTGRVAHLTALMSPHEWELHQWHTCPWNALSAVEPSQTALHRALHTVDAQNPSPVTGQSLTCFTV